jgi:hypothetical protein
VRPWLTSGRLLPGLTAQRLLTATPAARPLNKTMSAETADNAGTPQLKQFLMVSIKEFPRGINSDQVISCMFKADGQTTGRAPGPGLKPQASSIKQQAPSFKRQAVQRTSHKLQAPSIRLQASSRKLQAPRLLTLEKVSRHPNRGAGPR